MILKLKAKQSKKIQSSQRSIKFYLKNRRSNQFLEKHIEKEKIKKIFKKFNNQQQDKKSRLKRERSFRNNFKDKTLKKFNVFLEGKNKRSI